MTSYTRSGYSPGEEYEVRLRAISSSNCYSNFTQLLKFQVPLPSHTPEVTMVTSDPEVEPQIKVYLDKLKQHGFAIAFTVMSIAVLLSAFLLGMYLEF